MRVHAFTFQYHPLNMDDLFHIIVVQSSFPPWVFFSRIVFVIVPVYKTPVIGLHVVVTKS